MTHEFERHGWRVEAVYLDNPMRYDEKYLLINHGFAGARSQSKTPPQKFPFHDTFDTFALNIGGIS